MKSRFNPAQLVPLLLLGVFLLWVAATLQMDTFDSYENLLNARMISGDPGGRYFPSRAYIFPLLLAPFFYLIRQFASDTVGAMFVMSHLVAVTLSGLLVWMCYRMLRVHLDRTRSLLGAGLLAFNPLIIHTAPIAKEDQTGALVTTAAMYFYLRSSKTGKLKHLALAGLFTFLTMGTRYNLVPLLPLVFAAHELLTKGRKVQARDALIKIGWLVLLPLVAWLLVPTILYVFVGREELFSATERFLGELYGMTTGAVKSDLPYEEYPWEALGFLWRAFSVPIIALSLWGMTVAWRRRAPGALFHALWLGVFLVFHSLVLGHKEARYLFPLFVPLYFFAVLGIDAAVARVKNPRARATVLVLILAWPLYRGLDECRKFLDPLYRSNFARAVSEKAATLCPGGPVYWLGPFYALHPKEYVFDRYDAVTYLYHVFSHTILYYTGFRMEGIPTTMLSVSPGLDMRNGVFPPPQIAFALHDGNCFVLNTEQNPYVTMDVPEHLRPLVLERARALDLKPGKKRGVFTSADDRAPISLTARFEKNEFIFTLEGGSSHAWLIYMNALNGKSKYIGLLDVPRLGKELRIKSSLLPDQHLARSYRIMTVEDVQLFSPESLRR